jgi:beta-glucosidase
MAILFLSLFALKISAALSAVLLARQGSSAWQDRSLPAAQRAENLLLQLSWEEKIGQMGGIRQLLQPNATFNRTTWNDLYPLQHGILSESIPL